LRPGFVLLATSFVLSAILAGPAAAENTVSVADYGARPGSGEDTCAAVAKAVDACRGKEGTVLFFPPGRYDFHPENAVQREYYMSNTEPVNPKRIGLFLEDIRKLRVSGAGAQFVFHDRMTPMILDRCEDVTLEGFSIDWDIRLFRPEDRHRAVSLCHRR
jgi:hypothetical protein